MPRFLDTTTGEFRWIADPSKVVYAILSHTWRSQDEGGEQTYDQVRKIWKRMRKYRVSPGETPDSTTIIEDSILSHPDLSEKIKAICKVARDAGYKLVWIDSACIDKSSSAELAEAINSMFELYRLADVCYVYLVDVPDSKEDPEHHTSMFQHSRWHGRGWTLQELLAPKEVVFLTASWTFLGTKCSLVHALTLATNIDSNILLGRAPLSSASVARRMSWAASRETTRVEDEAYSLLGIFGVHMSPIYGEGRNAFLRLQEEIIKTIPDQSIFAWGTHCVLSSIDAAETYSNFLNHNTPTGLLASSPRQFSLAERVQPLSPSEFLSLVSGDIGSRSMSPSIEVPSLHSVITPEGVRLKALTIDLTELPQIAAAIIANIENSPENRLSAENYEHCLSLGRSLSLFVLRCTDQYSPGSLVTLALFHPLSGEQDQRGSSIATHVKCTRFCPGNSLCRVVCLEHEVLDTLRRKYLSPAPVEFSLLHHSACTPDEEFDTGCHALMNLWPSFGYLGSSTDSTSISLAPSCEEKLRTLGYSVSPLQCQRSASGMEIVARTTLCSSTAHKWKPATAQIHVTLTLTYLGSSLVWPRRLSLPQQREPRGRTSIHFSISRVRVIHRDLLPSGQDSEYDDLSFCRTCNRRGCQITECLTEHGRHTNQTSFVSELIPLPERVVAKADLLLPLSLESAEGVRSKGRYCRILRLAVECPVEYCSERAENWHRIMIRDLWLAIDLSGPVLNPEWSKPPSSNIPPRP
ncbi:hypothetical protein VTO73DRAFT_14028 [Trametes versicolor]